MAIIKIQGTVDRIFQDGRCVKLTEKSTSGDKEYTNRYTAWFDQSPALTEGDHVNISGFFSVKQGRPWQDRDGNERQSIDVNVNKARVDTGKDQQAPTSQAEPWAPTPPAASGADAWNTPPAAVADELPW